MVELDWNVIRSCRQLTSVRFSNLAMDFVQIQLVLSLLQQ